MLLRTAYALLWSRLEIEVEGDAGWAANLPTSRVGVGIFTWYHAYMNTLVVGTLGAYQNWDLVSTVHAAASFFLVEDTAWFLLNPYYGVQKYRRSQVWWHSGQPWVLGVPLHNFALAGVMALAAWWKGDAAMAIEIPWDLGVLGLLALHSWYRDEDL